MEEKYKSLSESDGISLGDIVKLKSGRIGYVSAIIDYGTHIAFFIDLGDIIKFPARCEWFEPYEEKGDER